VSGGRAAAAAPAPTALYVHFPLCLSVCPYCDFVVAGGSAARGPRSLLDRFADALVREVELRRADRPGDGLRSVYLGGGTPSLMSAAQVGRLLETVDRCFGLAGDAEVTLEANPGPDERGDLAAMRAAGVNRLSIGAQSLVVEELRRLGRRHSPSDVAATVTEARAAGFDNISLDLLYDIPGQTLGAWERTVSHALELRPEHLSAYALTLDDPDREGLTGPRGDHLPLRAGARRWREQARPEQDDDRAADMYELADEAFGRAGLVWYEISNWARPGRESQHNLIYWLGGAWEAVGPGAHAFDGVRTRRWNAARLDAYLSAVEAGRLPPGDCEAVDQVTADAERVILPLRTSHGLAAASARSDQVGAVIDWGFAADLLAADGDRVRLTRRGRLLSSELFARLLSLEQGRAGSAQPALVNDRASA
jgi:oxygen-independent coproporphyrinogen III oxidase